MMPTILLVGGFFIVVATLAFRAFKSRPKGGTDGLLGETGVVRKPLDPEGLVFVHGEYWRAVSGEKLEPGDKIEVEDIKGLILKVKRASKQEF
jgi:membrane-bound serine protease (ClpP class)